MKISDLISKRRKELGLTLEAVGDAVGVGKSTIYKWESGDIDNMRRDKIAMLAKVLDISPILLIDPEADLSVSTAKEPSEKDIKRILFGDDIEVTDQMWKEVIDTVAQIKKKQLDKKSKSTRQTDVWLL